MIYQVQASYLYTEDGERFERSLHILYECDTQRAGIVAGIKWGIERGESLEWGRPVCIKVDQYSIGRPQESGFIKTGVFGIFGGFEWKYDTSPLSIKEVLEQQEFYLTKLKEG